MLSPTLLETLRVWWRAERPRHWLFPGDTRRQHLTHDAVEQACRKARTRAGLTKPVTPHSLRRLYASLRFALDDDPVYVANQLGHTEPRFSMKVYASAVRRRERLIGMALREFDAALEWAAMGSGELDSVDSEPSADGGQSPETTQQSLFR